MSFFFSFQKITIIFVNKQGQIFKYKCEEYDKHVKSIYNIVACVEMASIIRLLYSIDHQKQRHMQEYTNSSELALSFSLFFNQSDACFFHHFDVIASPFNHGENFIFNIVIIAVEYTIFNQKNDKIQTLTINPAPFICCRVVFYSTNVTKENCPLIFKLMILHPPLKTILKKKSAQKFKNFARQA